MKFYLAVSIFVSATLLSGCESMKDVDRALYQLAQKVAPEDTITGQHTLNLTNRTAQIRKGNAYVEEIISKFRSRNAPLNEDVDAKGFARLQRIFKRIQAVSHFSHEDWKLVLVPDPSFNAFVTGGTYIVVHQGLLEKLRSDDEIAAVLGHEIAHVAAGHAFERRAHIKVLGLTGKKSVTRDGYAESYTNIDEQEADRTGILYMSLAGFDPLEAPNVWQRFASQSTNNWSYYRSHPAHSDRACQTARIASKVQRYYTKGRINSDHISLLDCNDLWCKRKSVLEAGEGGGLLAVLDGVAEALIKNRAAKTERARQEHEIATQKLHGQTGARQTTNKPNASPDKPIVACELKGHN